MSKLENQADILFNNITGWETNTLKRIGKRIKAIGKMSVADVKALNNIAIVKQDMNAITKELAQITGFNIQEVQKMYADLLAEQHLENKPLYDYRNKPFISLEENRELQAIVNAYARTTAEEMINLSKTSVLKMIDEHGKVLSFEKAYKNTLDKAVMQVATGSTDFNTAMRDSIKALGGNGIRVQYESGATRRLDSAVRQNLLWGAKQASIEYNDLIGQELGCDGIEIDWHANPRPSHEDMQGQQYSIEGRKVINGVVYEDAYEQGIDGEGGLLNDYGCLDYKTPVMLGISEPRYSKEELARLNEQNKRVFEIDGKDCTGFDATQKMRKLETMIREQKSIKAMAQESGDKGLVSECNANIKEYREKHSRISEVTGIKEDVKRMSVVKGVK